MLNNRYTFLIDKIVFIFSEFDIFFGEKKTASCKFIAVTNRIAAKMKGLQLILSVTLFTVVLTEPRRFDNYKVYEVNVLNKDHVNILRTLERNTTDDYDFWNSPIVGRNTDIMVPAEKAADFERMIKNFNMEIGVKVSNLQEYECAEQM